MAKIKEREKALELRKKKKMSYSQIKKIVGVSKSTLSLWLRNYPLSKERINELRGKSERRVEKFRMTMRKKRENRLKQIYLQEKKIWIPLSKRELFLTGLFLYWGEGEKSSYNNISLSNTDPAVIKLALYWFTSSLEVPKNKIRISLQLYSDMDVEKAIEFWSQELKINRDQFSRPYIKKSKRVNISHKGYGHGTCNIRVGITELKERILMAIKVISDFYSSKI